MKVLLKRFHLNGHVIEFHPQVKIITKAYLNLNQEAYNKSFNVLFLEYIESAKYMSY